MNWLTYENLSWPLKASCLCIKLSLSPCGLTVNSSGAVPSRPTRKSYRVQSKILRMVFNAPWYIRNKTFYEDSDTPFVEDEIKRLTSSYLHNLPGHPNQKLSHLHVPPAARRLLHRQWPKDVLDWTARLHNKYIRRTVTGQHLHWTFNHSNNLLTASSKQIVNILNKSIYICW